jgi:hypothetical protein
MFILSSKAGWLKGIQVQSGFLIEMTPHGTVQPGDGKFAGSIDRTAEQVSSYDGIIPSPEIDVKMEVWLSVLLGDVAHKAGDLHLLIEGLVDIFLGSRIEESQGRTVHGSDPVDFAGQDSLFIAECRKGGNHFLMIVYAYDIPVAVTDK